MGAYPTSPRSEFLAWCEAHVNVFSDSSAEVGLTAAQALAFKNAVGAASASESAATEARLANKAAVSHNTNKFNNLRKVTSDTVKIIKTFAQTTGNPDVYTIAQIPPPQDPSALPPPAQPTDLRVALDPSNGAPTITWKASNPRGSAGTSYIIRRRTSPSAQFEFVGVTGTKKFVDNTFFAGPDTVQYTVQGQRSDSTGPVSDILVVNFGRVSGDGANGARFSVTNYTTEQNSSPSRSQFRRAA